jgi:hypothetical protein
LLLHTDGSKTVKENENPVGSLRKMKITVMENENPVGAKQFRKMKIQVGSYCGFREEQN